MHLYLIMRTLVTSQPMHLRPVGSSQIATTCPQDIHYPTMHLYFITCTMWLHSQCIQGLWVALKWIQHVPRTSTTPQCICTSSLPLKRDHAKLSLLFSRALPWGSEARSRSDTMLVFHKRWYCMWLYYYNDECFIYIEHMVTIHERMCPLDNK